MYSFGLNEVAMNSCFRQHYRPRINRTPEWLYRLWLWF